MTLLISDLKRDVRQFPSLRGAPAASLCEAKRRGRRGKPSFCHCEPKAPACRQAGSNLNNKIATPHETGLAMTVLCKAIHAGFFVMLVFFLVLGSGAASLYAAAKMPGQTAGKSSKKSAPAASEESFSGQDSFSAGTDAASAPPTAQDAEKLLYTLNETLSENRKIRESMRDLQGEFEKMIIEKSDLADQVRKVERLAIQRNRETARQVDELSVQLDRSKKELEKLQADNQVSLDQKRALEKELEALDDENAKLRETLKGAILTSERDQIVERMNSNDAAVRDAVAGISALDRENAALKEQVIQSYFDLGSVLYDLGRYQDAAAQYRHVLEWDPEHAWAHHNMAIISDYHFHKVHDAIAHYQKYMRVKPASEEAREVRMRLWDLEQLTKLEPTEPLQREFKEYRKI